MGVVYEGFDPIIERTVAIKTIRKDLLDPEDAEEHSRRFLIEARAAGKLNHPSIVGIYDYGDEQGLSYIVMEFVQGKELKSFFDAKHVFTNAQTLRLMGELLDALGYSHRRGVIHRDVKPANIFVTEGGAVKLGDFGIARIDSTQKTHAGTVLGTPSYMSPEQIRGESADLRSDLYSAGVILYQFLAGERPFTGTMVAVMQKVLNDPPPSPSLKNPLLSREVDAVVARALAKRAADRFQTAAEFKEALSNAIDPRDSDDADATLMISAKDMRARRPVTAPGEATTTRAGATGSTYTSTTWEGTHTGTHSGATATTTGITELRKRAEETRRKAQEEMRRAEEELHLAEQAENAAELEAQTRLQPLRDGAESEMREAAAALVSANATLTDGSLLIDATAVAERLDACAERLVRQESGLRQFAALLPPLAAASRAEADALCARVAEQAAALRRSTGEIKSRQADRLQDVDQRLARVDELVLEGRRTAEGEQRRLVAVAAACTDDDVAVAGRAAETLSELAEQCDGEVHELGQLGLRLPDDEDRRLQAAIKAASQMRAAADQVLAEAVAARQRMVALLEAQRVEAEKRAREEEARRTAEELRRREEEATQRAQEEARQRAELEARRRAEEEARRLEEARRIEEEARRQAEAEALRRAEAEAEARRKAEAEARKRAEEEANARAEQARRHAEEEVRRKEEEARRRAEEEKEALRRSEAEPPGASQGRSRGAQAGRRRGQCACGGGTPPCRGRSAAH